MASFVLDCSVAVAWCFPDEQTPATKDLLDRTAIEPAVVPALWFLEVANVLALSEKKGRIDRSKTSEFISLLEGLGLDVDQDASHRAFSHLLPLCRSHQLTSYDAVYLELALRRNLQLATLDKQLANAAAKLGVKVIGK
jgi:predicted nucleic acid-binding protein